MDTSFILSESRHVSKAYVEAFAVMCLPVFCQIGRVQPGATGPVWSLILFAAYSRAMADSGGPLANYPGRDKSEQCASLVFGHLFTPHQYDIAMRLQCIGQLFSQLLDIVHKEVDEVLC